MTIRLRDSTNKEPDFFVWDLPDFTTKICSQFPIGSKELQTLLRVSQHLRTIVYGIYEKNIKDILKRYANYHTPLNRIISTQPNFYPLTIETICKIQQSIIQQIKALGIPCPNKHLGLEDIPRLNQAIEDLNLRKIWVRINRALAAVEGKPAVNASVQEIRLWMNENKNHLQNIIRLDLSGKALTTIPREITLLTGLQTLYLNNNQITVLPEGIFDALNQLQILVLNNNQITVLPQGIFDTLNQLQHLGLRNNQITILPQGIFDRLNKLQVLGLQNNQITVLPQGIFEQLTLLQQLYLYNNQISVLPQDIFAGLNQLQQLELQNNQITVLPQDIFAVLNQLQQLSLHSNQITVLPLGIFNGLNQLQVLCLSHNQITVLPQDIFAGLNQLQQLSLHSNQITVLPQGIFNGLNQLQWLDLPNNQISVLPQDIFAGLNQLQQLSLFNNHISILPHGIFDQLNQLQKLHLQNNQISVLPHSIFDRLIQLQELGLSRNQISVLPQDIFAGLNQLQVLAFSRNQITVLPLGIFDQLNQLQKLYLHSNQITVLPLGIFDQLNQLQKLYLQNNQITVLPKGIFDALNQLQELYLYGNPRLLFSYPQTPVTIVPNPGLNNDLKAFREFDAYFCRSLFAGFYKFAAQGNSFNDGMSYFSHLPPYLQNVIIAKVQEESDNSLSDEERFQIALKKAVRWIFEMSSDQLKNIIYTQVLQLAQESDTAKRLQNPALPPEDFTNPNWGRDHARDNILRLIDAMNLSTYGFMS